MCRVAEGGDSCTIYFQGNHVTGPAKIVEALLFISDHEGPFKGSEIPGPLTENEVLVLLRRLVHEGLLRRVERG